MNEAFCRYFSAKREMAVGRLAAGQLPEAVRTAYLEWSRVWREGGPTPGRLMIARRIGRGDRTAIVATDLGITASTVRNHLKAICRKTGIRSQVELVQHLRAWYREVGGGA